MTPTEESVIGQAVGEGLAPATSLGGGGGGGGGPPEPEIGVPPTTPGWLTRFAPTLRAGAQLTKAPVVTPSGQQWVGTPWEEQQRLAGYLDWAAGEGAYPTMLQRMAVMQPQQPSLGRRWMPPRQWSS